MYLLDILKRIAMLMYRQMLMDFSGIILGISK